ncbi:MAG: pilus assembly protein PilM [Candidatus Parcubacteria bacterium]|nr:MAG: pilus assembly protein PilM [Candidatus Parcubacteria bacterium]
MGIVDSLKQALGSFVVGSPAKAQAIGIDIGSSSIKMVQLRRAQGAAVLETYGELSLSVYGETDVGRAVQLPAEKIAEALTDLRKEAGITTPVCGVAIPYRASMVSIISLPDVGAAQLAKMIPIEARKYVPVPMKEVQLDWFIIPEEESRLLEMSADQSEGQPQNATASGGSTFAKVEVLLAAIYRDTLESYHKAVTAAKFQPQFYEIEAFSAMRSLSEVHKAPYAIVDFGAASTKFYAIELGLVRASHLIPRGGQDVTLAISRSLGISVAKAEELKREIGLAGGGGNGGAVSAAAQTVLDGILSEIKHALTAYYKRHHRALEYAVIMGGGAQLPGLEDAALQEWGISVRRADPFAKTRAPAFLDPVLREVGPEFAVAVGLALRHVAHE